MSTTERWAVRVALWWLALAGWTAALLTTAPVHVSRQVLPSDLRLVAAKTLHVGAYAFLTAALTWLVPRGWRWWLLAFLSLHACATEVLQRWVPQRTGSPWDVAIDHAGITLGLACTWPGWFRPR
jgi:hypothetical protein